MGRQWYIIANDEAMQRAADGDCLDIGEGEERREGIIFLAANFLKPKIEQISEAEGRSVATVLAEFMMTMNLEENYQALAAAVYAALQERGRVQESKRRVRDGLFINRRP